MIHVVRHVACRHRVEIEVWPARVEVHFRDDRGVNPVNAQVRFEATLYNAPTRRVTWEVQRLSGGPGAGAIDASGRYLAPDKGALPSGLTDVVVATADDDPLRKAFAWVTLVGKGPAQAPQPRVEIAPRWAYLYYPQNQLASHRNEFIDASNTMQLFRAFPYDAGGAAVEWLVDGVLKPNPLPSDLFRYEATGSGSTKVVVVTARIQGQPAVKGEAKVVLANYTWPKMQPVGQL